MIMIESFLFLNIVTSLLSFLTLRPLPPPPPVFPKPPITGYLVGGSVVGPGGLGMINELVQVETLAQLGVICLLMGLGMEVEEVVKEKEEEEEGGCI